MNVKIIIDGKTHLDRDLKGVTISDTMPETWGGPSTHDYELHCEIRPQ